MTIQDPRFVKALYRNFCARGTFSAASRRALANRRITLTDFAEAGLDISICDHEGPLLTIRWRGDRAVPLQCLTVDSALMEADIGELSDFVRRFLIKHHIITRTQKKGA
jgi:hypothetical protein